MNSSLIGRNAHGIGGRYASRCSVGAYNLSWGPPSRRGGGATTTTSSLSPPPPPPPPPAAAAAAAVGVGSVLTFLSPSPARSRRAVEFLGGLFRLPRIITTTGGAGVVATTTTTRDTLDVLHFGSSSPSSSSSSSHYSWDSIACACPTSGTILHFLSISSSSAPRGGGGGSTTGNNDGSSVVVEDDDDDDCYYRDDEPSSSSSSSSSAPLRLIAVHGSHSDVAAVAAAGGPTTGHRVDAVAECRRRLAETFARRQTSPFALSRWTAASALEGRARGLLARFAGAVAGDGRPDPAWIVPADPASLALDLTPFVPSRASASSSSSEEDDGGDGDDDDPPVGGSTDRRRRRRRRGEDRSPVADDNRGGGKLRELVLPFFAGAASSSSSSSPQEKLSASSLLRPLPGLYQCSAGPDLAAEEEGATVATGAKGRSRPTSNPGLVFRPLPAASEDLRLSPPSLVFQCVSLSEARELVEGELGGGTRKIGWRGHGQPGSLIVSHPSVVGIDVRICEAATEEWTLSSSFDESQDSLLAGSVAELQSTHVTSEGRSDVIDATSARGDERSGKGDCWVEFRSGFVKSLFKKSPGITVAKPPDLPYD